MKEVWKDIKGYVWHMGEVSYYRGICYLGFVPEWVTAPNIANTKINRKLYPNAKIVGDELELV